MHFGRRYIFLLALIIGCHLLYYPRYSLDKVEYTRSDSVKLGGVYIAKHKDREASIILFANGNMKGTRNSDGELYQYYQDTSMLKILNKRDATYPIGWGKYRILGDDLVIEHIWIKGGSYNVIKYNGKVMNDSTIMVDEYFHNASSTFHFYPLEYKPDSTSRYVR